MTKILIVDDSIHIRNMLEDFLNEQCFAIRQASNEVETLNMLQQDRFDLLLLDVVMPHIDGYQLIQSVRDRSNIPIIMLTSKKHDREIMRGFELGADDYLTKPFRLFELLVRIYAVLQRAN